MLLDELKRPFFPLVTIDTIVTNNSDKTLRELFEERYTKAEVDKLISDLGTLQRLRGTVTTYEELLAIEDPMPGDTYILLVEGGNNAEYMYIGDKWEALGPTASYTDVYGKEDVDEMLLALKQELNTKTERDDAEVLAQAKLYAEDLFANVPAPNLDEYYKKSETDAKIDEKINAIPVNNLWHYKGHVASAGDLPSLGQTSANLTGVTCSIDWTYFSDMLQNKTYYSRVTELAQGYTYYFGSSGPSTYYHTNVIYTNYAELIDGIYIAPTDGHTANYYVTNVVLVHVTYDANKPVYIKRKYYNGTYSKAYIAYDDGTYGWSDGSQALQISKSGWVTLVGSNAYVDRLISNLNKSIKFKVPQFNAYPSGYDSATGTCTTTALHKYDTLVLTQPIVFNYVDGYDFLQTYSDPTVPITIIGGETSVEENDAYTVGDYNDLYVCNNRPEWVPINKRVASSGGTGVVINRWEGVA